MRHPKGTTCATPHCQAWSAGRGFDLNGYDTHPYCELCQVARGEREAPGPRVVARPRVVDPAGCDAREECISCGDTFAVAESVSTALCVRCGGAA